MKQSSTLPAVPAASSLTEKELAAAVRLSAAMLQKLRRQGGGPPFVRIGTAVRYPTVQLADWLESLCSTGGQP